MTIDEQELGRLLDETADLASPPRFTAEELIRRAGRRRVRITTTALGAVAAVAAVAVIVPTALSSGHSQTGSGSHPPPPPPISPSYIVTVNGQTQAVRGSSQANYVIKPREKLAIVVDMTIPRGTSVTMTGLWMGITNGVLSGGPHGPLQMAPILVARPRTSLGPGTYKFALHWVAPASLPPGASRQLSTDIAWPLGSEQREVIVFNVQAVD
jgi:hypothetical protein